MTRHLHTIPELVAMLNARLETLLAELLPAGRRDGLEYRCGSVRGEPGRSLAVHIGRGPKRGVWADFASGERGDVLELIAHARCHGDRAEAVRWARAWLGLTAGGEGKKHNPSTVSPPPPETAAPARLDRAGKALWLAGQPIAGTPVEAYLAGRGVSLAELGRAPGALRFHPRVWCAERQAEAPAMLAAIVRGGDIVACHRTYLAPREDGSWGKAPIKAAKKVLGSMKGGYIPLWRGVAGTPLAAVTAEETVAVTEGIEDALTVALFMPEWRVIAAVSLGNMADIELPAAVQRLVLVFDRDGENGAARQGRERAIAVHQRAGRHVRTVRPPEGFKDINAWWLAETESRRRRTGVA